MQKNRSRVIVSRKWHEPEIRTFVDHKEVGSEIELDDFIQAVIEEVGNPTLLVTKKALHTAVKNAIQHVIHEMKAKTAHVV